MSSFETKSTDKLAIATVKNEASEHYSKDTGHTENLSSAEEEKSTGVKRKATGVEFVRRSKRERKKAQKMPFGLQPPSQAEEKAIAQALENSKKFQRLDSDIAVDSAPVFYPTLEEFENPIAYINKLREEASADQSGICKIVPPKEWDPPHAKLNSFTPPDRSEKTFITKKQFLHRLEEGIYFPEGKRYTIKEYEKMANDFTQAHLSAMNAAGRLGQSSGKEEGDEANDRKSDVKNNGKKIEELSATPEELIKEYWRIVEKCEDKVAVEYGNDLDVIEYGSGFPVRKDLKDMRESYEDPDSYHKEIQFKRNVSLKDGGGPDYYESCGWNLNNLPHWPGSLLRNIRGNYNGINVPWLYMGMLFSTFAWHNEDNYLYSINYHHYGAPKVWYGVPGDAASKFEECIEKMKAQRVREEKDVLQKLVLMTGPATLTAANVPLVKCIQNPGEFVVTFPKAFHGGFSLGFNCGEAVNFALPDWIPFGRDASETYRKSQRAPSISNERLLMQVARNPVDLDDVESCDILIKDLEKTMEDQRRLQKELSQNGITNIVGMPGDEDSEEYDEKRQCHVCMHMCYISALVCSCDAERVVCLRHWQNLCNCSPDQKCHLYWYSLHDIEDLILRVRMHRKKLM